MACCLHQQSRCTGRDGISGTLPNATEALNSISPNATQVVVGTLVAHPNDVAIIGYALPLFTVLKPWSESVGPALCGLQSARGNFARSWRSDVAIADRIEPTVPGHWHIEPLVFQGFIGLGPVTAVLGSAARGACVPGCHPAAQCDAVPVAARAALHFDLGIHRARAAGDRLGNRYWRSDARLLSRASCLSFRSSSGRCSLQRG